MGTRDNNSHGQADKRHSEDCASLRYNARLLEFKRTSLLAERGAGIFHLMKIGFSEKKTVLLYSRSREYITKEAVLY